MSTPVRINLLPHREQKRQARQRQFVSMTALLAECASSIETYLRAARDPESSGDECALFEDLLADRCGDRVRLEQERIGYGWLEAALRECLTMG